MRFKCGILDSFTLTKRLHCGLRKTVIIFLMKLRTKHEDKIGYLDKFIYFQLISLTCRRQCDAFSWQC